MSESPNPANAPPQAPAAKESLPREEPALPKPPVPFVRAQNIQPDGPRLPLEEAKTLQARAETLKAIRALPKWMRLFFWLFGIWSASPERLRLAELCTITAKRTKAAWVIPGAAILLASIVLLFYHMGTDRHGDHGMAFMIGRVFVFDYLIFLLAWVSGYGMARRWRTSQEMVEELTLSSIRPQSLSVAFVIGSLVPWMWLLGVFLVVEVLLFFVGDLVTLASPGGDFQGSAARAAPVALTNTLIRLPVLVVFAWFHFATVRLAHSMFALGALPKVQLRRLAITNLVTITMLVVFLSGVGSVATTMAAVVVMVPLATTGSSSFETELDVWMFGCIPGMLLVIVLKNLIASRYLVTFQRQWVMFQWWGAAEIEHPASYPPAYYPAADLWIAYGAAMDEAEAGTRTHHRPKTRAYQQQLSKWRSQHQQVVQNTPPTTDPLERRFGE